MARGNGWKVLSVYGVNGGARFARVQFSSGQRVDVRIRGTKDGRLPNAWGDSYPYEETRRKMISEMAARLAVLQDAERDEKYRAAHNPPLVTFANPPRGELMSKRVYELAYKHVDDSKAYKHKFAAGVCLEALPDGSIRVYSKHGKRLWGDF
jgi:hypothetical protein